MPAKPKKLSLADRLKNEAGVDKVLSADSIFSEEPVDLTTFIQDSKFMNNPPLGPVQFQAVRYMEQIYLPQTYISMVEEFGEQWKPVRFANFIYIMWGKGSGKDHVCRMAAARAAYLLLCLKSPQNYFGLGPQDDIHTLNVAQTAPQAHRAFFRPLGKALINSPWFSDKVFSEVTDKAQSIRLAKQIELVSGHSLAENFEGLNPILAVADEISGFESAEQQAARGLVDSARSAEGILKILKTSASTRFPYSFKVAAISYPRYLHDPIMNLVDEGKRNYEKNGEENSPYFVDGPRATWDVNPRFDGIERVSVEGAKNPIPNVAAYIEHYGTNSAQARAMYECLPERSANSFFRNSSAVSAAFPKKDEDFVEPLTINYYWGVDRAGAAAEGSAELATVPGWQAQHIISPTLVPIDGAIYALHADLAVSGDRAGISMAHVKNWERREHVISTGDRPDMQNDDRPVVKIDFATCYESDMKATTLDGETVSPREIQIRWFRNLVRELKRRGFVIGSVTFDNFQSQDSIQILESWGIPADKLSVDRNNVPYTTLRDIMYDGRLEGYYVERLIQEIEGLSQLPNGKIDHPPGGSKDIADSVCGATCGALVLGGDEGEDPMQVDVANGSGYDNYDQVYGHPYGNDSALWGNVDMAFTPEERDFLNSSI